MFLPVDHSRNASDLPEPCSFRAEDWRILAGFWHPVAFTHEVGDGPLPVRLLDVDLVVYRAGDGYTVARDRCPHRGTKLSIGQLEGGCLVCPMHGLHFDAGGQCVKIPSLKDPNTRIPPALNLTVYSSCVRYDLIWVCLTGEPIWPLPEWPALESEDPDMEKVLIPVGEWNASASRAAENFMDIAHHPFVHVKTFGNPDRPVIGQHEVTETDQGLHLDFTRYEVERGWHDPEASGERLADYHYDLTYPFAKELKTVGQDDGIICYFYDIGSPISATQTRIFQLNLTNHLYCSKEEYPEYQLFTNEEDRVCVETQHPEALPLDLREELHIPADRFSLAYRKALVGKFGLGAPLSS